MEIEEFKIHKAKMEFDINTAISTAMGEFKEATGYSPSAVSISIINISVLSEIKSDYIVSSVHCEVEL